jgi:hypothetical protein
MLERRNAGVRQSEKSVVRSDRLDRARLSRCGGEVELRDERDAARVVPHRLDVGDSVARIGQREDGCGRLNIV